MDENLANEEREAFESQAPGLYTGSGKDGEKKGKFRGIFKRKGPIALIIGLIFGAGGLIGGSQLLQPFSMVEQLRETFNSMQTSTNMRSGSFLRYQMDTSRTKNPIRGRIFGEDTFKITKSQAQKLAAQGIEYDDDYDGTRVLKFDDGSGQMKIVTADVDAANRIGNGAVDFNTLYKTNADFYNGYNKGSMTWRGAIANWFDTTTVKFLRSNRITRNLFQDFQRKVDAENNGNSKGLAIDLMAKGAEDIVEGGQKVTGAEGEKKWYEEIIDWFKITTEDKSADGLRESNKEYRAFRPDDEGIKGGGRTSRASLSTEAGVRAKLDDISGNIQKGANVACTVFNVLGGISALVTASEALQVINLVTSYLEAIDKVKAGDGTDSPIHDLTNALNEKKTNTNTVLDSVSLSGSTVSGSETKYTTDKSAMESSGMIALYGGGAVNPKDPSVQSFNFSGSMSKIFSGLGSSLALFEACGIAKVAANATSATLDAVAVAGCIFGAVGAAFTFGVSAATGCGALATEVAVGIAMSVTISVIVAGVISALVPTVASMLTRDLITNLGGEDLGNALVSGANMYMGNTHRANGGSLANREKYVQFAVAQQSVIADNAKFERQNRNPFDATSKYTFMGTLVNQALKFASTNSVMSAVTSASSVLSSSIIAMSGSSASAYDIAADLPDEATFKETCPYLWSIGAVGDAYCNPYAITDVSTIELDPIDVINKLNSWGSFLDQDAEDGNVQINGKSDLAKYILYCDNRTSMFGMTDWNIANQVGSWGSLDTESTFVNSVANGAIGAIPVIGDVIDVVSDTDMLNNAGYVSGESCVTGNTVDKKDSPNWEKAKYYQRFIEDQSLAETIGLFDKSAVTAFLDEYYEENPLDNSYEGILARYSGLTKDDVIALLDFIDYSVYVANYDPSERYAFGENVKVEENGRILFVDENEEKFYNVWWYNNIYDRVGRAETRAKKAEYTIC